MLESLFGSISKERVLAYLFSNEEGYARGAAAPDRAHARLLP